MSDVSKITLPDGSQYSFKDAASRKSVGSISLTTSWSGSNPYTQVVTATGYTVTAKTKVDLIPNADVIATLRNNGVSQVFISNNNGTLTAVAINAKPTTALTIQAFFSEVN